MKLELDHNQDILFEKTGNSPYADWWGTTLVNGSAVEFSFDGNIFARENNTITIDWECIRAVINRILPVLESLKERAVSPLIEVFKNTYKKDLFDTRLGYFDLVCVNITQIGKEQKDFVFELKFSLESHNLKYFDDYYDPYYSYIAEYTHIEPGDFVMSAAKRE